MIDHYRCIIVGREPEIDGASGGDAFTDEFRRLTRQRENKKVDRLGFLNEKKRIFMRVRLSFCVNGHLELP